MDHDRLLAGRFRLMRLLPGKGGKAATFLALDERTSRSVVCAVLPMVRVAGLQNALGLKYPRLARVLDVVHDFDPLDVPPEVEGAADGSLVIAEWIPGRTLHERLKSAPLPAWRAVEYTAHVASCIKQLHERACVHGAISPRCVLLERADGGPVPAVSLCVAPPDGSCFSPERAAGSGPSAWDDAWAVHVILYAALTGQHPFTGSSAKALARSIRRGTPSPLAVYDAGDDDLQEILDRGFSPSLTSRTSRVDDLIADLAMWLARNRRRAQEPIEPEEEEPQVELDDEVVPGIDSGSLTTEGQLAMEAGAESWWPPGDSELPAAANDPSGASRISALQPPPVPAEHKEPPPASPPAAAPTPPPASPPAAAPTPPPASPPAAAPTPMTAIGSPALPKKTSRFALVSGAVALALFVAILSAVGVHGLLRAPAEAPPAAPSATAKVSATPGIVPAPPKPSASSAASAPVAGASAPAASASAPPAPVQDVSACVATLMPKDTFVVAQDFTFLCEEPDAHKGLPRVRSRIVAGGRGALTGGAREWASFGWYELPFYGIMRATCCPGATPIIRLPDSPAPCPSLGPLVEKVSLAAASRSNATDLEVVAYEKAALCLLSHGSAPYTYESNPFGGGQISFGKFMARVLMRP